MLSELILQHCILIAVDCDRRQEEECQDVFVTVSQYIMPITL